ncbi:MAG: serine--tRNA ligase, partial [Coriobacteriia bacterium]
MLDARFVRENPEAVRTAMANRRCEWDLQAFLTLDEERRSLIGEV